MRADVDQHVDGGRGPQDCAEQVADVARMAALAERPRLARDLHDSVTQTLVSLHLTAQAAAELWDTQPEQARAALDTGATTTLVYRISDQAALPSAAPNICRYMPPSLQVRSCCARRDFPLFGRPHCSREQCRWD